LAGLVRELIAEEVASGTVRGDVPVDELAAWAMTALASVEAATSRSAADRAVALTLDALRPARR
jgi:hypothetical protein